MNALSCFAFPFRSIRFTCLVWAWAALVVGSTTVRGQVLKDRFSDSVEYVGTSFVIQTNNLTASAEPNEPAHLSIPARRSLWGLWRPETNGQANLTLQVTGTSALRLVVYEGSTLGSLTRIAGFSNGLTNALRFPVTVGHSYRVVVDSSLVTGTSFQLTGSVAQLGIEEPAPNVRLRAPAQLSVRLSLPDGETVANAVVLTNSTVAGVITPAQITLPLELGLPGPVRIEAFVTNQAGTRLEADPLNLIVRPGNDDVVDAVEIPSTQLRGVLRGDSQWASAETVDRIQRRSLWWRWAPRYAGSVKFSLPGETPVQSLWLGRGSSPATLTGLGLLLDSSFARENRFFVTPDQGSWMWFSAAGTSAAGPAPVEWSFNLVTLSVDASRATELRLGQPATLSWNPSDSRIQLTNLAVLRGEQVLAQVDPLQSNFEWTPQVSGALDLRLRGQDVDGIVHESDVFRLYVPPVSDRFATPEVLPADLTHLVQTNAVAGLTSEPQEPWHVNARPEGSMWWSWTPGSAGMAEWKVRNSDLTQLRLAIYQGTELENLRLLANNLSPRGQSEDHVLFGVRAGERYLLVVDGVSSGPERHFVTEISYSPLALEWPLQGRDLTIDADNVITVRTSASGFIPAAAEFFLDGTSIGSAFGNLPALTWRGMDPGPHTLDAVATSTTGEVLRTLPYSVYLAPSMDLRANAGLVPSGATWEVSGDFRFSTWEWSEDSRQGGDSGSVWWRWQPPATKSYLFAVTGAELTSFTAMQYNEAGDRVFYSPIAVGSGLTTLALDASSPVYFQVAGPWNAGTPAAYRIELRTPPVNDDLADAIPIAGAQVSMLGTNEIATLEPNEPASGLRGSLWWRWTAPDSGNVTFKARDSDCVVAVALYRGSNLATLRQVGETRTLLEFSQQGSVRFESSATYRVHAGESYFIALGPNWVEGPGVGTIRATLSLQAISGLPPNDDPSSPTVLPAGPIEISASNLNAQGVDYQGLIHTVWFEWTAPFDGAVSVTARSDAFSPILVLGQGVYPSFMNLGDNMNLPAGEPISINIRRGEKYVLAVSGAPFNDGQGAFTLKLSPFFLPPPPANDHFEDRVRFQSESLTSEFQLTSATLDSDEPQQIAQGVLAPQRGSVWWEYTAPAKGFLIVELDPVDTVTLFRGNSLAALTAVDVVPWQRPVIWPMQAGEVVQIAAHGARLQMRTNELRVRLAPERPINDAFSQSTRLTGTNLNFGGFLRGASREVGEPRHLWNSTSDRLTGESCWWSWAAPLTGLLTLEHQDPDSYRLAVYRGPSVDRLTRLSGSRGYGLDRYAVEAGQVYHFAIERTEGALGNASVLLVAQPFEAPTNDDFENAQRLTPGQPTASANIGPATRQPGEPQHRAASLGKSLWWRFVMPYHGELEISNAEGSARGAMLALYTGPRIDALTRRASGTDYVRFAATAGQEYFIAAEVPQTTFGDIQIRANPWSPVRRSQTVPGNIVLNPSFEQLRDASPDLNWSIKPGYIGYVGESGGADGGNFVELSPGASLEQSVPVVAGRTYRLRYAVRGGSNPTQLRWKIRLGSQAIAETAFSAAWPETYWHWFEEVFTAQESNALLRLDVVEGGAVLDAFSLVWLNEPPSIASQPQGGFAYAGGGIAFRVGVRGSEPFSYQWSREGQPIEGATGPVLTLDPVGLAQAGQYDVVVTNPFGSARSETVRLEVQSPTSPQIVLQPQGDAVLAGQYLGLSVAAVGPGPLSYQWFRNGVIVPGATQRQLIFPQIRSEDLGEYSVQVQSYSESTWSLPALISRATESSVPPWTFLFSSWSPVPEVALDAYVYDVDGVTRLLGDEYAAQLYVGPSVEQLRPVGEPKAFMDGFDAGRWQFAWVTLPNIPTELPFVAQVRAWDASKATTYEEARALGHRFGRSDLLPLKAPSANNLDGDRLLRGLNSFSLQLGQPQFTVGKIEVSTAETGSALEFRLTGAVGFRYLLESRADAANWRPVRIFENFPGEVRFQTPIPSEGTVLFRARILD